jgi:hypothetical protein
LQSSLTRVHSYALVYSTHPPVSVCGTDTDGNTTSLFLADPQQTRSGRSPSCQVNKVCLWIHRDTRSLIISSAVILNCCPSPYAVRLWLRFRLTLGRTSLPRKPWVYGGAGFHCPCRYLCLHPHFSTLHGQSPSRFDAVENAPLPCAPCGTYPELRYTAYRQSFSARDLSMSQLLRTV